MILIFQLRIMKRKELQALAKLHGVRANAKSSYIIEQLTAIGILGAKAKTTSKITAAASSTDFKVLRQSTRKELQALAKLHGVRANTKSSYIIEQLTAIGILRTKATLTASFPGLKCREGKIIGFVSVQLRAYDLLVATPTIRHATVQNLL